MLDNKSLSASVADTLENIDMRYSMKIVNVDAFKSSYLRDQAVNLHTSIDKHVAFYTET